MVNLKKYSSDSADVTRKLELISEEELNTAYGCSGKNWIFGNRFCCLHDCANWITKKATAFLSTAN